MLGRSLPPTVIYEDNMTLLLTLRRRDLSAHTRHTRVNLGFMMDAADAGHVIYDFASSADQVADIMTAAEDPDRFERNRAVLLG